MRSNDLPHMTRTLRLTCAACRIRFPNRPPGFLGEVVWTDPGPSWTHPVEPYRCYIKVSRRRGRRWSDLQHEWLDAQAAAGGYRVPPPQAFPFGPRSNASVVVVEYGRGHMVNAQPWWISLSCPSCPAKPEGPIGLLVSAAAQRRDAGDTEMQVRAPAARRRQAA